MVTLIKRVFQSSFYGIVGSSFAIGIFLSTLVRPPEKFTREPDLEPQRLQVVVPDPSPVYVRVLMP